MSDAAVAGRSPFEAVNGLSMPGLSAAPDRTRYILRGRPGIHGPAAEVLGFALPNVACRAAGAGDRHALWLGPDEWLLLAPGGERVDKTLAFAIGDVPHSLVEVSHRQVGVILDRPDAASILSVGCALDFDLTAFPVGMCTRTMFAKAEVILWRTGEDVFQIEVWRSFADYLWRYLVLAGVEFA
jgi:sarcosine oxidase subunit gamma